MRWGGGGGEGRGEGERGGKNFRGTANNTKQNLKCITKQLGNARIDVGASDYHRHNIFKMGSYRFGRA